MVVLLGLAAVESSAPWGPYMGCYTGVALLRGGTSWGGTTCGVTLGWHSRAYFGDFVVVALVLVALLVVALLGVALLCGGTLGW